MNGAPLSVIALCCNGAAKSAETIEGALCRRMCAEAVETNDESKEPSIEVIDCVAAARELAVELAGRGWLYFLDTDDCITSDAQTQRMQAGER